MWLTIVVCAVSLACNHAQDAQKPQAPAPATATTDDAPLPKLTFPPDNSPPPAFDADRAMQYTKEIVKFGPRPIGSANHKKVEDYFLAHL